MKISFQAAETETAQTAYKSLKDRYGESSIEDADVIVALGGDGTLLHALHTAFHYPLPVFGMNRGSVGFLLNTFNEDDLIDRISAAQSCTLYPLEMKAQTRDGKQVKRLAVNEVSMLRQRHQAAKLRISVDGKERLDELICDGLLTATPAGSTAYNFSAHGPIIPLGADILALTPISAFRPRRWRGALLPQTSIIDIDVISPDDRPVAAVADFREVRDVRHVQIKQNQDTPLTLLYDADLNLDERIRKEQFLP